MSMRKMKKISSLAVVTALVVGSLTGCGSKNNNTTNTSSGANTETTQAPTEETTQAPTEEALEGSTTTEAVDIKLKVWAPQEEQTSYDGYGESLLAYMCEAFDEAHPEWNIEFDYGVVSEDDAKAEVSKDPEASADVFMFASDQLAYLVESGMIAPISLFQEEITAENGGVDAGAIKAATFDDLIYGVPFTPNSWFMYYDSSKYTADEVLSLETMMAKDLGDGASNFCIDIDNGWYLASFFFAGGCSLFGDNGTDATICTFNDANGLAVGNYVASLATNPKFMLQTEDAANAIEGFTNGTLGAWCSGTWNAEAVKTALGENYAATKLPTININGTDSQLKSFADYKYIGVSMNPEGDTMAAAQALATYLGGEECQKIRFEARSIAPTVTSLVSDPAVASNIAVAALSNQSQFTQFQSTISQMNQFWNPAEAFGAGCYNGEITADNMQAQLDSMVTNILTVIAE